MMNYFQDFISLPDNMFEFVTALFFSAVKLSFLLGIIYLVIGRFQRFSAATKHFIWMLGLAAGLLLPFLFTVKGWEIPVLAVQVSSINKPFQSTSPDNIEKNTQVLNGSIIKAVPTEKALLQPDDETVQQSYFPLSLNQISGWLAVIWLVGATLFLLRLMIGIITANLRVRQATGNVNPVWTKLAAKLSQDLNLKSKVSLLSSEHVSLPVVCGLRRSKVLLPLSADKWSDEQGRMILLHELAHVRRRDCLTQLLAQIVCTLYWFNPLVWYVARQLRELREEACDDYVLNAGIKPSIYAGYLLEIARLVQKKSFFNPTRTATVAIAGKSRIETRLLAILDSRQSRRGLSRFTKACAVFAVAIIALPLSALQLKSQPNESASLKESKIKKELESEYKTSAEVKDYLIFNPQDSWLESAEQNKNKKAQPNSLNSRKSSFESERKAGAVTLEEQNSRLNRQANSKNSEDEAGFSAREISEKDAQTRGLSPLSGLRTDLGSLDRLKNALKSKDMKVRQKALSEIDELRARDQ